MVWFLEVDLLLGKCVARSYYSNKGHRYERSVRWLQELAELLGHDCSKVRWAALEALAQTSRKGDDTWQVLVVKRSEKRSPNSSSSSKCRFFFGDRWGAWLKQRKWSFEVEIICGFDVFFCGAV